MRSEWGVPLSHLLRPHFLKGGKMNLKPDFKMAKKHLNAIGNAEQSTLQLIHDSDKERRSIILHGSIDDPEIRKVITKYTNEGYGLFSTVNETDGKGRKKENITRIQSIVQDDDNGFDGDFPLDPSMTVVTSHGKKQNYWFLVPTDQLNLFTPLQMRLIEDYGSDPAVKDLPRVTRVAGSYHQKNPKKPFKVKLVYSNGNHRYSLDEIIKAFPPIYEQANTATSGDQWGMLDVSQCIADIQTGGVYHNSLLRLAAHLIASGNSRNSTISLLQGLMKNAKRRDFWQVRYDDIGRIVDSAIEKFGKESSPKIEQSRKNISFVDGIELALNIKPIVWLIEDIIENTIWALLLGMYETYKSFLALDWGLCIAAGIPWGGRKVKQGNAFAIIGEGKAGYGRRIKAWCIKNDVNPNDMRNRFFVSEKPIALYDEDAAKRCGAEIERMTKEHGDPRLVIIDTLARNFGGNENSAEDISFFLNNVDAYVAGPFSKLLVHHTPWSNPDRPRGSTNLPGSMDAGFLIKKIDQDRRIIELSSTKMKDAERFETIVLQGEVVVVSNEYDEPITSLVLNETTLGKEHEVPIGTTSKDRLLGYIKLHSGVLRSDLVNRFNKFGYASRKSCTTQINKFIKNKVIHETQSGRLQVSEDASFDS